MLKRMLIHGLAAAAIVAVLAAAYQASGSGRSGLPAFAADRGASHHTSHDD